MASSRSSNSGRDQTTRRRQAALADSSTRPATRKPEKKAPATVVSDGYSWVTTTSTIATGTTARAPAIAMRRSAPGGSGRPASFPWA